MAGEHIRDPYGRPYWRTEEARPHVETVVEAQFAAFVNEAQTALNRLGDFWTSLYGPNEALMHANEDLLAMDAEFYGREDDV